jgi:cytochrome oxidase Cu insertion factor (SCO1/SenC/PrrC family)
VRRVGTWAAYVIAGIFALFAGLGALHMPVDSTSPYSAGSSTPTVSVNGVVAPDFQLQDQTGRTVALHQWVGRPVVLAFMAAGRGEPVQPARVLEQARRLLGARAEEVHWALVNASPLAFSPSVVQALARTLHLPSSVRFLTASPITLVAVWQDYHVDVSVAGGRALFTPAVVVIDARGIERATFLVNTANATPAAIMRQADELVRDLTPYLPAARRPPA